MGESLLSPREQPDATGGGAVEVANEEQTMNLLRSIAAGAYKGKSPGDVESDGIAGAPFAPHSLEAALWGFHHSSSFSDGACLVVNLGEDADTCAAIYGSLAGAFWGEESLPVEWLD